MADNWFILKRIKILPIFATSDLRRCTGLRQASFAHTIGKLICVVDIPGAKEKDHPFAFVPSAFLPADNAGAVPRVALPPLRACDGPLEIPADIGHADFPVAAKSFPALAADRAEQNNA